MFIFHLLKDMLTSYYWVCNTAVFVEEDDVALYTIKTIDDPRTLNKTLYIRPPENILSQAEVVSIWEKLIGKKLMKTNISEKDFLAIMAGNINHICYSNCTACCMLIYFSFIRITYDKKPFLIFQSKILQHRRAWHATTTYFMSVVSQTST